MKRNKRRRPRKAESQKKTQETGGLRIAQQDAGGFALALVPEPFPGDDVVTDGSTRVYVDPEASVTLADQRLDVEPAADGTMFTLGPQQ